MRPDDLQNKLRSQGQLFSTSSGQIGALIPLFQFNSTNIELEHSSPNFSNSTRKKKTLSFFNKRHESKDKIKYDSESYRKEDFNL